MAANSFLENHLRMLHCRKFAFHFSLSACAVPVARNNAAILDRNNFLITGTARSPSRVASLPYAGYAVGAERARLIACHTRSGVAGISMRSIPSGDSASMTALITVGGAPMVPDSPMPLTPSGFVLHGTS